jgi:hypothetical protein
MRMTSKLARDEAVLAMARTARDQLSQPMAALLGWVELWETDQGLQQDSGLLRAKMKVAANRLAARIDALAHVVRYEPTEVAGQTQIDLARAQRAPAGARGSGQRRAHHRN